MSELGESGEISLPIIEKRRAEVSNHGYIVVSGQNGVFSSLGHSDVFTNEEARVMAFCGPSPEAIEYNQKGQDAIAVASFNSNGQPYILLAEADGVGQSFRGEVAAELACTCIAEEGTSSLANNLDKFGSQLQNHDLAKVETGAPLVDQALDRLRLEVGSRTTLNQILINPVSGELKGYFHGDGNATIVRKNGGVESKSCGTYESAVSTEGGIQGLSNEYSNRLNPGDIVFLYSDGLDQLTDSALKQIAQIIKDAASLKSIKERVWDLISSQELRDDDRSLLIYLQKEIQKNTPL